MPVPVTLLSGGLGAGKTTLVNRVLSEADRDVAVLVNDMGEVNVDADLIESRSELSGGSEITELSNGCICCGLQGELDAALLELDGESSFDHLLIEPSGVSDPAPIVERFVRSPRIAPRYDLDALVTVIDARAFHDAVIEGRPLGAADEVDESRPISELLVEQVELADVLLVNKCDLIDADERAALTDTLRSLQPRATLLESTHGDVAPDEILDTGLFDEDASQSSAGWKQILREADEESDHESEHGDGVEADHAHSHDHEHSHEHGDDNDHSHDHGGDHEHSHDHPPEAFGLDSFTYHRRQPVHPERFVDCLQSLPASIVRMKGILWVAGRDRHAFTASFAGSATRVVPEGRWIASLPESKQEIYRRGEDLDWDPEVGDRETRLVVIGKGLDEAAVTAALDETLVRAGEREGLEDDRFPRRTGQELVIDGSGVRKTKPAALRGQQ